MASNENTEMSDYTTTNTTSLWLEKFNTEPVMTIHPGGRVTVSDKFQPDEAAAKVVEAFKTQWMADVQATKIRELQERIQRLEDALNGTVNWIVELADSGDAGFWDAETVPPIIAARAALKAREGK
jgi:hypothetical protein